MLAQFMVGNYRSFKDVVTFSLLAADIATAQEKGHPSQCLRVGEMDLLKCAAIYGANGSGKSNLLQAFNFMKWIILDSAKETWPTDPIKVERFKPRSGDNPPSLFELIFFAGNQCYRYGFKLGEEKIEAEWLYQVNNEQETFVFVREDGRINCSKAFGKVKHLVKQTRDNSLFLSVAKQGNDPLTQGIFDWFNKAEFILDLSQVSVQTLTFPIDDEDFVSSMKHHFDLDLNQEQAELSGGTQRIVALAGPLLHTLHHGGVLVIDELEVRLHPLITCAIVRLFSSEATNPRHAQLIFTTHDTNLLSEQLFRRDQVWFTEKDKYGATDLYSLAEFKVGREELFRRNYLCGRYGAIPTIPDSFSLVRSLGI